ncbi:3-oxoacyl-ACP synthase III family protein [Streptomyces sp. NBC_01190]|uniref:3-oxoacyl-ACP synthase III family protein n=1 Tax=Streptomyces sp. NBC_01190 TaxID=2903767 RepID=UPI00386C49DD|nr:ketoacyl-ACP synthase III [Streptomyces sp. NBC_01190]
MVSPQHPNDDGDRIGIVSTGSYLPATVVENDEVARAAGVTDEWIVRKTGIRRRRRAAPEEATSDLAAEAGRRAMEQAGLTPADLAYIVVATSTPDHPQPATAGIVQHLLGARNAACFDLNSVCSGFVYALAVTQGLLRTAARSGYGLVIGADIYSRILNHSDRRTAVLFGDGAGAAVLGPVPSGRGILGTRLLTWGDRHEMIKVPAGGSRLPASAATVHDGSHYFTMDGGGVRGFVQDELPAAIGGLLTEAGVDSASVRHFVPHQANGVMLADVWPRLGLGSAELHLTVDQYANTGSASVAVTLDEAHRLGRFAVGDRLLLAGFGGGMSVAAQLADWTHTAHARTPGAAIPHQARGPRGRSAPNPAPASLTVPSAG